MIPSVTRGLLPAVLLLLTGGFAYAQGGDDCASATALGAVSTQRCLTANLGAATGSTDLPTSQCIPELTGREAADVYYAFEAANDGLFVTLSSISSPPQFILYEGTCADQVVASCASDAFGTGVVTQVIPDLTPGGQYVLRVSNRDGGQDDIEVCLSTETIPVAEPNADCTDALVICDETEAIDIPEMYTAGDIGDLSGLSCGLSDIPSKWFRWTCDQPGDLEFTITPNDPSDDLDFVLFELGTGSDACATKQQIRCMASGEIVGEPISEWQICTGSTGLRDDSVGEVEPKGCEPNSDNFLLPLRMANGRSYALVVLNSSFSGRGFELAFGGSGTFGSPDVGLSADKTTVDCGDAVTFGTAVSADPGLTYAWDFGPGATPATSTDPQPAPVTFSNEGTQTITLTVNTPTGCTAVETIGVLAQNCCALADQPAFAAPDRTDPTCPGEADGSIRVNLSAGQAGASYSIDLGPFGPVNTFDGLEAGTHQISVRNPAGCEVSQLFTLTAPPAIVATASSTPSSCGGGGTGGISVVTTGGGGALEYSLDGTSFQASNTFGNLEPGFYDATVRDAAGCQVQVSRIEVEGESELDIDLGLNRNVDPGQSVAVEAVVAPAGSYDYRSGWSGLPFTCLNADCSEVDVLTDTSGRLTLALTNADGCTSTGSVSVTVADGCFVGREIVAGDTVAQDPTCRGFADGLIEIPIASGGAGAEFSLDGGLFTADSTFGELTAGSYDVVFRNAAGCVDSMSFVLDDPPGVTLDLGDAQIAYPGDTVELSGVADPPGDYDLAWLGVDTFTCLDPGCQAIRFVVSRPLDLTADLLDARGCPAFDTVSVDLGDPLARPLFAPTAFSPNGDRVNDRWTLYGPSVAERVRSLRIFDRWGNEIVTQADFPLNEAEAHGWDGTYAGEPCQPGLYVFAAEIEYRGGDRVQVTGDITLLR